MRASHALRTTALLAHELGTLSALLAGVLRVRAWAARREGNAARFVEVRAPVCRPSSGFELIESQDVKALRAARVRSEAAVILRAPGWLFAG